MARSPISIASMPLPTPTAWGNCIAWPRPPRTLALRFQARTIRPKHSLRRGKFGVPQASGSALKSFINSFVIQIFWQMIAVVRPGTGHVPAGKHCRRVTAFLRWRHGRMH